jgi:integrase
MDEFDARAAKLLQPGEHMILPQHPGLRLSVTAAKRSWIYRYKSPVDGGMRQVKIGEWPRIGYTAAREAWEKLRDQRAAGADAQLQKRAARREARAAKAAGKKVYTVEALILDYLSEHIDQRRKPKGRAEVRRLLTSHTKTISATPAEQLLRSQAYELLQGLADRPVLMGMVRQEMGAAYDHALDAGRLEANTPNWWRQVLRGKMPRTKGRTHAGVHTGGAKRALNERELGVLINFLPNLSLILRDALTMYLWTGTRGAEIVTMQYGEVQEEPNGWWWTIPKEKTKNARHATAQDLRVPLIGRARAIVLRRRAAVEDKPETMGYLFPSRGGRLPHIEQKTIQSSLYAYQPYAAEFREKQGRTTLPLLPVSHWSPHDLRRSVRTLLASMGCPDAVAEAVLGHMPSGIVGVYNRHTYDAERLDWLTKLDVKLESLAQQHAVS